MEQIIRATKNESRIASDRSRQSIDPESISICEGFGCNSEAIGEIEVNAGEFGVINLNLCGSCKPKFKQSVVRENKGK